MATGPYLPDKIDLESSLGYYLSKARNVLVTRMDQALRPLGITSPQIGVILLLAAGRAHTPYELARVMSYDSGSMTRMLDRLEKKGFIKRARSGTDRRMVELQLTEAGHATAQQLPGQCCAVLNQQVRGFSAAELATLTSLLARFIANGLDHEAADGATSKTTP